MARKRKIVPSTMYLTKIERKIVPGTKHIAPDKDWKKGCTWQGTLELLWHSTGVGFPPHMKFDHIVVSSRETFLQTISWIIRRSQYLVSLHALMLQMLMLFSSCYSGMQICTKRSSAGNPWWYVLNGWKRNIFIVHNNQTVSSDNWWWLVLYFFRPSNWWDGNPIHLKLEIELVRVAVAIDVLVGETRGQNHVVVALLLFISILGIIVITIRVITVITLWVLRYWYVAPLFCLPCRSRDFACLSPKSSTPNQKNASLGMTMIDEEERGDHIDWN